MSPKMLSASASVLLVGVVAGCGGGGSSATGASGVDLSLAGLSSSPTPVEPATPIGPERYVTVAFWQDATCSGAPNATTAFPLNYSGAQCFSWPGRSGENSVSNFSCGQDSFSYTQWTTLTCSGGQVPAGTRKTVTVAGISQTI